MFTIVSKTHTHTQDKGQCFCYFVVIHIRKHYNIRQFRGHVVKKNNDSMVLVSMAQLLSMISIVLTVVVSVV